MPSSRCAAPRATYDTWLARGAVAPRWGNLKTRLDARGKLATYGYDALNRLVQVSYGDQTVSHVWDACANGLGRLCQVIDGSGSTSFAYDAHGRVLQQSQTLGSVTLVTGYSYNGAGQRVGLVTPSGQTIAYSFLGNNCCHCAEQALRACGQSAPPKKWPNWPINPGPQPGEPGYKP